MPSKLIQQREDRLDVLQLLRMGPLGKIHDHAAIRVAKGAEQVAGRGRCIITTEHGNAGQGLEGPVVSFGVNDTDAVSVQDQLLTQQPRDLPDMASPAIKTFRPLAARENSRASSV